MKEQEQESIEPLKYQLRQWRELVNKYLPPTDCDRDDVRAIEALIKKAVSSLPSLEYKGYLIELCFDGTYRTGGYMEEDWNKDEIINNTKIHLSMSDRVRVLFGKTIHLNLRTKTENEPGRCESSSSTRVDRFWD